MKFRIIEQVYNTSDLKRAEFDKEVYGQSRHTIDWVIEKKTLWGWREVMRKEITPERVSHKTYADAEAYMITNYMLGDGWFRRDGNIYTYHQYTYNFPG